MEFLPTAIVGAFEVRHNLHSDARGRFKRQYCEREFASAGLNTHWVQVNHSVTIGRRSIRGMHFQRPPAAETKLVSCPVGRAFDVAVDLRRGSCTFLKWAAVEIDETASFYIPEGCAHGFQALSDEVHLIYMHSAFHAPEVYYPLVVEVCDNCFLAQVGEHKSAAEIFDADYTYFSSFSRSWLEHAERFAVTAAKRFGLGSDSHVVEVASNDGYLLQYF